MLVLSDSTADSCAELRHLSCCHNALDMLTHQGWQQGIAKGWMACKATMNWRPFPLCVNEQSTDISNASVAHLALTHSGMGP